MSDARRTSKPQSPSASRAQHSAEAVIAQYIQDLLSSDDAPDLASSRGS